MISNPVIKFEKNFYEKSLKKALKRRKSLYTFLEMEDLVLHEYVIKNGGYYGLMQNELVVKFKIAIFSYFLSMFLHF